MSGVLIDECVDLSFSYFLESRGISNILRVPGNKELCGTSDSELEKLCLARDLILVSQDKKFLKYYTGRKVRYFRDMWKPLYELINYYESGIEEPIISIGWLFN
jgi:hypothetical protein